MKPNILVLAVLLLGVSFQLKAQQMDSVSYSLGVLMGKSLQQQGFDEIDPASFAKAIEDITKGNDLAVSLEDANKNIQEYQRKKLAGEGEAFLAENAKRPEVTVLPSGLQYEVLVEGNGPKPKPTDKVKVHYHGTLIDGEVFDSSVERGQPASFGVTQVIPGWVEGLQLMPVGSKWKLYIPYDLAYGERGAGAKIKPFSALIFEVELLGIQ